MKRFIFSLLLGALILGGSIDVLAWTEIRSDARQYLAVATPTFSIPATSKTNIGAMIPQGAQGFRIRVFGDEIIFNCSSRLATGTFANGDAIASGSVFTWDGPGQFGDIWCAPRNASAATGTIWAW